MIYRLLTVVLLLWLYGCSGGISGTGDGGPVQPTDEVGVAVGDSPDNSAENTDSASRLVSFPSLLILDLPGTLQADTTDSASTLNTPGTSLRDGITAAQLDIRAVQIDLFLLDQYLNLTAVDHPNTASLSNCAQRGECELLDQQINLTVNTDAEAFASSRPAASALSTNSFSNNTSFRTGDILTYNNVSLQSGLAGYFDSRLQYSRANGSQVILQWSIDLQWVSLLAQNPDSTLHSLLQKDSSEMTLRRTDHLRSDATVQLLAIQNNTAIATDATYIEADLSQVNQSTDEAFFVRALANANTSAIFSETLLSEGKLYREATNMEGQLADLETCVEPCTQWQTLLDSQTLSDTFFDDNQNTVTRVAGSIVNPVDVSTVPVDVSEFVVTVGDDTGNAINPITRPDSLVCGGQRLRDSIRVFCWQPTPFESGTFIFDESRINGSLNYRLITQ